MPRILLSDIPTDTESLRRISGLPPYLLRGREAASPRQLHSCTPYLLCEKPTLEDEHILACLCAHGVAAPLTRMSQAYGGENTLGLADIVYRLLQFRPSVLDYANATVNVTHARIGGFYQAVQQSQQAIVAYHRAVHTGDGDITAARQNLMRANEHLQREFHIELRAARRRMSAQIQTLTSSNQRLLTRIHFTRSVSTLNIASRFEADKLARLARNAKYLGNGLTAIDIGSRVADVHAEYRAGGDWERRAFVEGAGFGAGTIAGSLATYAGVQALGLILAATPAGWVLIVAGFTVAAAVANSARLAEAGTRNAADSVYDNVRTWMVGRR